MSRPKLEPDQCKSRLATQIEEWFRENRGERYEFGELLDLYAVVGESTDTIAERFRQITRHQIKIVRSTFGGAVRQAIEQGKTRFEIDGKYKGNPHRKPGSGRKAPGRTPPLSKNAKAILKCACGARYRTSTRSVNGYYNLQDMSCKECGRRHRSHLLLNEADGPKKISLVRSREFPGIYEEIKSPLRARIQIPQHA